MVIMGLTKQGMTCTRVRIRAEPGGDRLSGCGSRPAWILGVSGMDEDGKTYGDRSRRGEEEGIALLTLKLIPDLGNRSILRLIRHFGSAEAALRAGPKELSAVAGLRGKPLEAVCRKETTRSPHSEFAQLKKNGIRLLCLNDPDYPANLSAIPDPPAALFIRGSVEPRDLVSVAVVGSRAASPTGMVFTERLCMELVRYGVSVVSGLAVGIDSAAHRGAIRGRGRTLAVLGCGLDIDYPRGSSILREEIVHSGALITEFPLATPPAAVHFPLRNRIISGLSLGVVVVEAAHRSGSLITARLALEQGREVFAVPGMARNFRSVGPHRLLKEGAKLVECAEDILEEIRPMLGRSEIPTDARDNPGSELCGCTEEEKKLLVFLDRSPIHIDEISRFIEWPISRVMAVLLALELKGFVRQLPGKYFVCDCNAPH